jgi:hypothetical protein
MDDRAARGGHARLVPAPPPPPHQPCSSETRAADNATAPTDATRMFEGIDTPAPLGALWH